MLTYATHTKVMKGQETSYSSSYWI